MRDPLSFARGVVYGVVIGLCVWLAIAAIVLGVSAVL